MTWFVNGAPNSNAASCRRSPDRVQESLRSGHGSFCYHCRRFALSVGGVSQTVFRSPQSPHCPFPAPLPTMCVCVMNVENLLIRSPNESWLSWPTKSVFSHELRGFFEPMTKQFVVRDHCYVLQWSNCFVLVVFQRPVGTDSFLVGRMAMDPSSCVL